MILQTFTRTPVAPRFASELGRLVADPSHDLAVTSAIGAVGPLASARETQVPGLGTSLRTLSLQGPSLTTNERALASEVGGLLLKQIKREYAAVGVAVDAVELVLATREAWTSWTEPEHASPLKVAVKTGKAMLAAADFLKGWIPALHRAQPVLEIVGVLVKIGDKVEHVAVQVQAGSAQANP